MDEVQALCVACDSDGPHTVTGGDADTIEVKCRDCGQPFAVTTAGGLVSYR